MAPTPVLWPPHVKSWLIGKDSDAGRDWGQEEKGATEDEMAVWHHWLDGRESQWTPEIGDGQGGLACCNSWGHKESDMTERLIWSDLILYWFCQISKWIHDRYTCVPHPEPSSLLPPHTIPLGHPSAPAPSIQYRASNLDWRLVSYMILYMFQYHSPKLSHPHPFPQSPKDCSIHLCLFCCLAYRIVITIFLNSIYMH